MVMHTADGFFYELVSGDIKVTTEAGEFDQGTLTFMISGSNLQFSHFDSPDDSSEVASIGILEGAGLAFVQEAPTGNIAIANFNADYASLELSTDRLVIFAATENSTSGPVDFWMSIALNEIAGTGPHTLTFGNNDVYGDAFMPKGGPWGWVFFLDQVTIGLDAADLVVGDVVDVTVSDATFLYDPTDGNQPKLFIGNAPITAVVLPADTDPTPEPTIEAVGKEG
jgi:hypothetical protein